MLWSQIPEIWQKALHAEQNRPYWAKLEAFLEAEEQQHTVFPPREQIFTALQLTPLSQVRVVILGQDPYHDDGQAHGLSFSVLPPVKPPPSLQNIYKELQTDLGIAIPKHGYLKAWAEQGVLLLNTVLTVRAHTPLSHRKQGWETFTDAVIDAVHREERKTIFVLWGAPAQKKAERIDTTQHTILTSAHPSPLSAHRGFFGCRHFSTINRLLEEQGEPPIEWRLPALTS